MHGNIYLNIHIDEVLLWLFGQTWSIRHWLTGAILQPKDLEWDDTPRKCVWMNPKALKFLITYIHVPCLTDISGFFLMFLSGPNWHSLTSDPRMTNGVPLYGNLGHSLLLLSSHKTLCFNKSFALKTK